jgi:hypothetical protein
VDRFQGVEAVIATARFTHALRVVNFDSDEKSDQKIDIFSANQISGFLQ